MAEAGLAARAASIVSTSLWWPGIFRRSGRPPGEHVRAAGAAFIFLVPREIFRDQPKATNVVMLRGGFWIEPQTFAGVPQDQLVQKAVDVVRQRYKTRPAITSVEPIYDEAEQELKGYMAFTKP